MPRRRRSALGRRSAAILQLRVEQAPIPVQSNFGLPGVDGLHHPLTGVHSILAPKVRVGICARTPGRDRRRRPAPRGCPGRWGALITRAVTRAGRARSGRTAEYCSSTASACAPMYSSPLPREARSTRSRRDAPLDAAACQNICARVGLRVVECGHARNMTEVRVALRCPLACPRSRRPMFAATDLTTSSFAASNLVRPALRATSDRSCAAPLAAWPVCNRSRNI